jgi:hypothetical protein
MLTAAHDELIGHGRWKRPVGTRFALVLAGDKHADSCVHITAPWPRFCPLCVRGLRNTPSCSDT